MSAPPIPPPLEPLARRTFSFFPPILNVEHNEWRFRKATWSEILVVNAKSDLEIWIPRRLIGEVSSVDEPVMIVGLLKELEYKAGAVWPHERRVIEMPAVGEMPQAQPGPGGGTGSVAVLDTRAGSPTESRIGRLVGAVLALGLLLCCLVIFVFRSGPLRTVKFTATDQDFLTLSRNDDYFAVVRKLGPPAEDRWREKGGELQYRALWYPQRSYFVILLGSDRNDARYIGALDRNWHVIHYVELPNGAATASMLRSLERF
jgi:hypothetical protein